MEATFNFEGLQQWQLLRFTFKNTQPNQFDIYNNLTIYSLLQKVCPSIEE